MQLTEKEVKSKLDEDIRSLRVGVEAKVVKDKEGLEAVEKQHSMLIESKTLRSHRRKDLDTEVEAGAKIRP